jgi:predicted O-methyltransferase YrrM
MHELTRIAKRIGHTDKVGSHIYTEFYGPFLNPRRESVARVLEIGICDGGSLLMWAEFFPNAEIYGVDIKECESPIIDKLEEHPRIHLLCDNAYQAKFVKKLKKKKFDIILDDGAHDMPSWERVLKLYPKMLTDDGVLMIEDVYSLEHAQKLIDEFKGDKNRLSIIDRRTLPGAFRKPVDFTYKDGHVETYFVTNEIVLVWM